MGIARSGAWRRRISHATNVARRHRRTSIWTAHDDAMSCRRCWALPVSFASPARNSCQTHIVCVSQASGHFRSVFATARIAVRGGRKIGPNTCFRGRFSQTRAERTDDGEGSHTRWRGTRPRSLLPRRACRGRREAVLCPTSRAGQSRWQFGHCTKRRTVTTEIARHGSRTTAPPPVELGRVRRRSVVSSTTGRLEERRGERVVSTPARASTTRVLTFTRRVPCDGAQAAQQSETNRVCSGRRKPSSARFLLCLRLACALDVVVAAARRLRAGREATGYDETFRFCVN